MGIPRVSLAQAFRCQADIAACYPRLLVPADFTHLHAAWVHTLQGGASAGTVSGPGTARCIDLLDCSCDSSSAQQHQRRPSTAALPSISSRDVLSTGPLGELPLIILDDKHALAADPTPRPLAAPATLIREPGCVPVKYSVRLALLTDASAAGPPDPADRQHLLGRLKCLVTAPGEQGRAPIMQLPGAAWSRDADGGDPSVEDACLVRTAVRVAAAQLGLDLSPCRRWVKLLELHYHRPLEEDGAGGRYAEQLDVSVVLTCLDAAAAHRVYGAAGDGRWREVLPTRGDAESKAAGRGAESSSVQPPVDSPGVTPGGGSVPAEARVEPTSDAQSSAPREATPVADARSSVAERLAGLRYEDLRAECRAAGLDAKGRKDDLLRRLTEALAGGPPTAGGDGASSSGDAAADEEPAASAKVEEVLLAPDADGPGPAHESAPGTADAAETPADSPPGTFADELPIVDRATVVRASAWPAPPSVACLVASSPRATVEPAPSTSVPPLGDRVAGSLEHCSEDPASGASLLPSPATSPAAVASSKATTGAGAAQRPPPLQLKLVSLRRLLQYNEADHAERLFELSMLAEAVSEALTRSAARVFADALVALPDPGAFEKSGPPPPPPSQGGCDRGNSAGALPALSGNKRQREQVADSGDGSGAVPGTAAPDCDVPATGAGNAAAHEPHEEAAQGQAEGATGAESASVEAAAVAASSSSSTLAPSPPADGTSEPAAAAAALAPQPPRNEALRAACSFLDRAGSGFIEARDLEALLGRVGLGLSLGATRRLVARATADKAPRARSRCWFTDLIAEAEKAKALA